MRSFLSPEGLFHPDPDYKVKSIIAQNHTPKHRKDLRLCLIDSYVMHMLRCTAHTHWCVCSKTLVPLCGLIVASLLPELY